VSSSRSLLRLAPAPLLDELTRPWAPPRGSVVVAAVSGGGDSIALLHLLAALAPGRGWTIEVATLDHGLRGPAGAADRSFVVARARALGLHCHAGRASGARPPGRSVEEAARLVRREFLENVAHASGAAAVALAHTLDDQAETVLMRLARGCGLRGAGAMARRSGLFWRPLLGVRRADLRALCRRAGIDWREDETNRSVEATRNRVRHLLLPALERACGPGAARALARSADLAREDEEWLAGWAERLLDELTLDEDESGRALDRRRLVSLPPPPARRVLLAGLARLAGRRTRFAAIHARTLLDLAQGHGPGRSADLPHGLRAERRRERLLLARDRSPRS